MNYETEWKGLSIAIEKIEGETTQSYQAFLCYAFLQGTERTYEEVANRTGFNKDTMRMWAHQNKWNERVSAIDATRWLKEFEERESLLKSDNEKFVQANRKIKHQTIEQAEALLKLSSKLITRALDADEVIYGDYVETKDGRMIPTTTTIKMQSKVSDIPRLIDTAVKSIRAVNDLPTEVIERITVSDEDLSNLSIEEIIERRNRNRSDMANVSATIKLNGTQ